MPEIDLRDVRVERGGNRLLGDISLRLPADFCGSLIGPSGSGKTTALRVMNRLIDVSAGEVFIDGDPITNHDLRTLRRRVAMVFSETHLLGLTVEENLRLLDSDISASDIETTLDQVGLAKSFLPRREETLSAGERHRVALARALIGQPELILLDEVTSSLDPSNAFAIIETLREIREARGLGIVLASHVLDHVRALGGECVVLVDGEVVEMGDSESVLTNPSRPETRAFLNGERMGASDE